SLAALELGFRLLYPQDLLTDSVGLYVADRDLGFRLAPSFVVDGELITNALGLRERDLSVAKRPGTIRILCLGDSFTFGMTPLDQSWPKILERRLQRRFPGRSLEVINAGVPRYSTYQELAWL